MIKYALKCQAGHGFESWFQSADAFDRLRHAGQIACPLCGETHVDKALMAPTVAPGPDPTTGLADPRGTALARLRAKVEAESDYVGDRFASEARAMHLDETPARAIHGEANPSEARALLEDGVPILPLPFGPPRKPN